MCPSLGQIPCWPFNVCDHTASRADCSSIVSQGWQLLAETIGLRGHHALLLDGQQGCNIFFANWVRKIRSSTKVSSWKYVGTRKNPADIASRGASAKELLGATEWWNGPAFLWSAIPLPVTRECMRVSPDDPEKRMSLHTTPRPSPPSVTFWTGSDTSLTGITLSAPGLYVSDSGTY